LEINLYAFLQEQVSKIDEDDVSSLYYGNRWDEHHFKSECGSKEKHCCFYWESNTGTSQTCAGEVISANLATYVGKILHGIATQLY
jgi:hypothetical protein